jgi:hypothetical protein
MADRLQELLQQRALIKEHLAWLDAEIAAASGRPAVAPTAPLPSVPYPLSLPTTVSTPATAPIAATQTAREAEADKLLAKFADEERQAVAPPDKKGCWVLFSTLLVISMGIAVALIYFFYR